jgi:DNA-binding transcriptional regulator YiaG
MDEQGESWAIDIARAHRLARSGQGERIRKAAGLSLAEEARGVGVHPTCVWAWERGKARPTGDRAVRWVRFLDRLQGLGDHAAS